MRGGRIALAAVAAAGALVAGPRALAAPPGPHDPCARNGRDVCGTTGVGFYRDSAYGLRWFGDYHGAVPAAHAFCLDLGYWYASGRFRYRPQAGPLRTRGGELVSAVRRRELAYAIWRFGRSAEPARQAAVMLYVHSLMGGARPGELDPAQLGANVESLYRRIGRDASRYHGPYRIEARLPRRLLVGRRASATIRVLSAAGAPLRGVRVTVTATGAEGVPATVRTGGSGGARLALTPTSTAGLRLRLRVPGLASSEPHVFAPTAGLARTHGQRLVLPASSSVTATVAAKRVGASPRIETRVSDQLAAVGSRIHDTVTVSGLGGAGATVQVQLWGPFAHRGDVACAGVPYWSGRFVARGDSTTATAPVRVARAGYYVYRESIALQAPGVGFVTPCGGAAETTLVRAPTLATVASPRVVRSGGKVRDRVSVRGLGDSSGVVEAELYGPFGSRAAIRCTPALLRWHGRIPVHGDSDVSTPAVPVATAGFYVFRERLTGPAPAASVQAPCAPAAETVLAAPMIVTGRGGLAAEAPARAAGAATPVRLRIPALAIDAPIEPAGIDVGHGMLGVPADIHRLGWWRDGAAPGARSGAVLVAGHVDSARDGRGALFPLPRARRGEVVRLTTAAGPTFEYRIASVRRYPKSALPIGVFASGGPPRLVVVTCGGPFDAATGHYLDDVVVTAMPLG